MTQSASKLMGLVGVAALMGREAMPWRSLKILISLLSFAGYFCLGAVSSAYSSTCQVDLCGFLYSGGTFSTLYGVPGSTYAQGRDINNKDQIVGISNSASEPLPFLYSGGTYTNLSGPPGSVASFAFGINDESQMVGVYSEGGRAYGYEYSGGSFVTLAGPPGSTLSVPSALIMKVRLSVTISTAKNSLSSTTAAHTRQSMFPAALLRRRLA
jgi:uncharacterized membrane protein